LWWSDGDLARKPRAFRWREANAQSGRTGCGWVHAILKRRARCDPSPSRQVTGSGTAEGASSCSRHELLNRIRERTTLALGVKHGIERSLAGGRLGRFSDGAPNTTGEHQTAASSGEGSSSGLDKRRRSEGGPLSGLRNKSTQGRSLRSRGKLDAGKPRAIHSGPSHREQARGP
jgi:hypothetical protein